MFYSDSQLKYNCQTFESYLYTLPTYHGKTAHKGKGMVSSYKRLLKNNTDEKLNGLTRSYLSWQAAIFMPLGRSELATAHPLPPRARLGAQGHPCGTGTGHLPPDRQLYSQPPTEQRHLSFLPRILDLLVK